MKTLMETTSWSLWLVFLEVSGSGWIIGAYLVAVVVLAMWCLPWMFTALLKERAADDTKKRPRPLLEDLPGPFRVIVAAPLAVVSSLLGSAIAVAFAYIFVALGLAALLLPLYGLIRFVQWAWEGTLS